MTYITKIMKFVLLGIGLVIATFIELIIKPVAIAGLVFMASLPFLFIGYFLIAPFII